MFCGAALGVHRIAGHQSVAEIELVQKVTTCGDLVGLRCDLELAEYCVAVVIKGADQVRFSVIRVGVVAGTADGPAVHRDHSTSGDHGGRRPHPCSQYSVQVICVDLAERSAYRRFRWSTVPVNTEFSDCGVVGVVDPFGDRGERLRSGGDGGQPDGEQVEHHCWSAQPINDFDGALGGLLCGHRRCNRTARSGMAMTVPSGARTVRVMVLPRTTVQ